jgi:excisionase family DNA binding protein
MSDLIGTTEAATLLAVTPRRIVALIQAGRLPASRIGHSWLIRRADIEAFVPCPVGWQRGRRRSAGP